MVKPKVSIILLDWSCRESFHILYYLNKQTVPREQYEIIWIEYYSRRSTEIERGLKECEELGKPYILDKWIVMQMPEDVYYHKHLMYNIGIVESRGRIICIMDSDAITSSRLVENIIKAFEEDRNIVLHLDEVRNTDRRFYPFNYPTIEDVVGEGCINWKNGKTKGVLDKKDPLHSRNYGACMCAMRDDLISIGGADEHIDFLGHICGPYEMTFRLSNAGKREIWHHQEFLYHMWHPGTDGWMNFLGPHDGMNMSTTALEALVTSRVMPLLENESIRLLRTEKVTEASSLFETLIQKEHLKEWSLEAIQSSPHYHKCEEYGFVSEYGDYNIVRFRGSVYGIPQTLGHIDLNESNWVGLPGVICGSSEQNIEEMICNASVSDGGLPKLIGSILGYSLVLYTDRIFCVPQSLGFTDIGADRQRNIPQIIRVGSLFFAKIRIISAVMRFFLSRFLRRICSIRHRGTLKISNRDLFSDNQKNN